MMVRSKNGQNSGTAYYRSSYNSSY